jgi:hypothetical protein
MFSYLSPWGYHKNSQPIKKIDFKIKIKLKPSAAPAINIQPSEGKEEKQTPIPMETKQETLNFPNEPKDSVFNQFKQGDILFGLLEPRNKIDERLEEKKFEFTCVSEYNKTTMKLLIHPNEEKIKALNPTQAAYYQFLVKHKDYLLRERPGAKKLPRSKEYSIEDAAIRRSCKLLLIDNSPERKSHAHMTLTDVDFSKTCDKKKSKGGVTDSEYRAAFRYWQKYGKHPFIHFYDKNNRETIPPWEQPSLSQYWEHYDKQRQAKKR